ncbi:GatB/YqeY domain-containing protein [bacterium]|nr:GatB/YqeY domain-containing protein [bacterium]
MSLIEKINTDLKKALKSRDELTLSVLRMAKSDIKNKEIDKRDELDENEVVAVLTGMQKRAQESLVQFEQGNRQDLADKTKKEIEILKAYLPEQLSEAELEGLVLEAISEVGAQSPKDMGNVMKALMPKMQGRADGKLVSSIVQKKLQTAK